MTALSSASSGGQKLRERLAALTARRDVCPIALPSLRYTDPSSVDVPDGAVITAARYAELTSGGRRESGLAAVLFDVTPIDAKPSWWISFEVAKDVSLVAEAAFDSARSVYAVRLAPAAPPKGIKTSFLTLFARVVPFFRGESSLRHSLQNDPTTVSFKILKDGPAGERLVFTEPWNASLSLDVEFPPKIPDGFPPSGIFSERRFYFFGEAEARKSRLGVPPTLSR